MRKSLTLTLLSIIFVSIPLIEEANATEDNSIIHIYQIDVTGDGQKETIQLEGELLSSDSTYYPFVVAKIQSTQGDSWEIELPDGIDPSLHFIDITNNGAKELIYKSTQNNKGSLYTRGMYSFTENHFTSISLPKNSFIHGKFQENFLANIYINPHDEPITVDLKNKADGYIKLGIYKQDGTLVQQQDIQIKPIHSIESVQLADEPIIETLQHVSSMIDSNYLGVIQLRWRYSDQSWELLESTWKE